MEVFIGLGQLFSCGELSKSWPKYKRADKRIKSAEQRSIMSREQHSWYFVVEEISKASVEEQSYRWLSPSLFLPLCKLCAQCSVLWCSVFCFVLCSVCCVLWILLRAIGNVHLLRRLYTSRVAFRCWLHVVQQLCAGKSLPDFVACILCRSFTVFYYLHYMQLVLGATLHLFSIECFPLRIIFCSAAEPLLVMHKTLLQFITPPISIATGQNIWDAFQSAVVCKRRPLHPVGWSRSTSRFIMLKPLSWKNQASIDKSYREIFWSNQLHWFSHVSSAGLSGE